MRKTVGGLALAALMLAACGTDEHSTLRVIDENDPFEINNKVDYFIDEETGCEYLYSAFYTNLGMTPRIATDGVTHKGCKEAKLWAGGE